MLHIEKGKKESNSYSIIKDYENCKNKSFFLNVTYKAGKLTTSYKSSLLN